MNNNKSIRLYYIALLLLMLTLGVYLVQPIWDTDFWWHIASGKWIVNSSTIPNADPFGVFANSDPVRLNTVLHGQWLGQVLLYLIYTIAGENGILALGVSVILTCIGLVYLRASWLNANNTFTLLFIALMGLIALGLTGTRPQLFSYAFAAITFYIIDLARVRHKNTLLYLLPLIAVVWANCHGGVILGTVLLFLYSGYHIVSTYLSQHALDKTSRTLAITTVLFAIGSLLTPNGFDTYVYLFNLEGSQLQQVTSEYISSLKVYTLGYKLPQIWVVSILLLSVTSIVGLYKQHKSLALISLFLMLISVWYFRYLAFLLFIAGPYVCLGMTILSRQWQPLHSIMTPRLNNSFSIGVGCIAVVMLITGALKGWIFQNGINANAYPVNAVEFIKQQKLSGRAFNLFKWGGYIIWHLDPAVKPYIDGRMLDTSLLPPYTHMLWATTDGIQWFNQQRFDLVILPAKNKYTGEVYALHQYLRTQPTWQLVFRDISNENYVYQHIN